MVREGAGDRDKQVEPSLHTVDQKHLYVLRIVEFYSSLPQPATLNGSFVHLKPYLECL